MSSVAGISPSSMQASAAVVHVSAVTKAPEKARDDYVAPVETTNMQAAKTDVSVSKMTSPSAGQNLDIKV